MDRRPRILIDALLVGERPTGVGRSILELVDALSVEDRGIDFTVLVTRSEPFAGFGERPGWAVLPCPGASGGTLRKAFFTQRRLPGLVASHGADLLHSCQFIAPLRLGCRSVVTVHDLAYFHFPQTVEQPRRAYYRALVPRSLRRADRIVTNSVSTARDVQATFPDCAQRVEVTPFGTPGWVAGVDLSGSEEERRAAVGRDPKRPFFLFVGTLEPRKNLEGLLVAYRDFLSRREGEGVPDLVFVGGRGWRDSGLRSAMEPLLQSGRLDVVEYCDQEALGRYYRAAQALLLPSLHEGFGFPILEAMALGVPVLTSNRGAMAEVAGDAALLVDPIDAQSLVAGLEELAFDAARNTSLREAGRIRAREWSWARCAEATVEAYHRALSPTSSSR